jgi:hypothetical protein
MDVRWHDVVDIEIHDTQRIYSLLTKTRVCDRLIEHRLCWRCSTAC